MTYAAVSDVAARWGKDPSSLDDATTALITARLADAERLILKRIPDLADQITTATVDVADVVQVEADAVLRVARNPDGYISETDGSYTYQLSQGASAGMLEILPSEWELLGVSSPGAIAMVPRLPSYLSHLRWDEGWPWSWL